MKNINPGGDLDNLEDYDSPEFNAPQITTWQTIKLALWIMINIGAVGIGIMLLIKFS